VESISQILCTLIANVIDYSRNCAGQFYVAEADESDEETDDDSDNEAIISPASYVTQFSFLFWSIHDNRDVWHSQTTSSNAGESERKSDDNEAQFFRRIHVIPTNNIDYQLVSDFIPYDPVGLLMSTTNFSALSW